MDILTLLDRPIAFHRCFVDLTGSVTAALFLSQAVDWQLQCPDPEGWWSKSLEEWQEETGMSRGEQESARRCLLQLGIIEERRYGVPARSWFRINEARLLALFNDLPAAPPADAVGDDHAKS